MLRCETDLSTFEEKTSPEARVSSPIQDSRRQEASRPEKEERAEAAYPRLTPPRPSEQNYYKGARLALWKSGADSDKRLTDWRIAVSRKVVKLATQRNRWRRRIREILRKRRGLVRSGFQLTFKVHSATEWVKYAELEQEISKLLEKAGLLLPEEK